MSNGYCSGCGTRAPAPAVSPDVERLRGQGWLLHPSRGLRAGERHRVWNLLCPACVQHPTPFVRELISLWESTKRHGR